MNVMTTLNYKEDYPLLEKHPDKLKAMTGRPLEELTIDNVLAGGITMEDGRIHKDTLLMQAEIAQSAGDIQIAANLRRAAELTNVPDDFILKAYNTIRPFRGTMEEILAIADTLEKEYDASETAEFIREAGMILKNSHRLKGDR